MRGEKNNLLLIQIYALAISPFPSLSYIFPSLSKWHLWMTRAWRVSGAEGGKEEGGGKRRGKTGRERAKEAASPSHFRFP